MSSINSVRNLQILYFSGKIKKLKRFKKRQKKCARTSIILYYSYLVGKHLFKVNNKDTKPVFLHIFTESFFLILDKYFTK